ncbi:MAG: hypothetical protein NTV01_02695 [Bacteroidia bacterium]|nr:hypothetical protein [Bacteroidia bacterium]
MITPGVYWSRFLLHLLLLGAIILSQACSTDIEINGDGATIPIIYCFLNPDDSIQYLRLSKTFTIPVDNPGQKPSAGELVYSEEPEIDIEEDGSVIKQRFYKCDLINGIKKDTGWFPVEGMQIFATKCKIKPATQYSLVLFFQSENRIVFGQTQSFGSDFRIIDPSVILYREADLFPGQDYYARFSPVVNAQIYQTTLTFIYDEVRNGLTERKEFKYKLEPLLIEHQDVEYLQQKVSGILFFKELSRRLSVDPEVIRKPICFNFQISCGGFELYKRVNSERNFSAFSEILYTNLDNAQGLFSSLKHQFINNVIISRFTIDSIAMSPLTKHLGFLSSKDLLMNEKATELPHMY